MTAILRLDKTTRKPPYLATSFAPARDKRLSYSARGLLLECLTHDNGTWVLHKNAMVKDGKDKKGAVTRAWRELESYGYAMSYTPTGNNRNMVYVVAETPDLLLSRLKSNHAEAQVFYRQAMARKVFGKPFAFQYPFPMPDDEPCPF